MADWLRRIRQILKLNRRGVLVLVDGGRADHLPALMRAMGGAHGDVPVCFEPWELEALPESAMAVFVPTASHAIELNSARPILADRGLRVIIWAERDVSKELARSAPDFFDWISHRVECPKGLATFFVEGVRVARRVGVAGIVVGESSELPRSVSVYDDDGLFDDDPALGLIWHDESDLAIEWRIELAFEADQGIPVVIRSTGGAIHEPGWWWLDHRPMESVRGLVGDDRLARRTLLLLGGERSSIAWVRQVAGDSKRAPLDLAAALSSPTHLVDMALDRGFVSKEALILGTAPPLLRRGFFAGRAQPRRVLLQWSKRSTAPVGWQVIFAPKALLAQPDDGAEGVGRALIEHYVRRGERQQMFLDDRAIRAIRSLSDDEIRGQVLGWVGHRDAIDRETPRDFLLRAFERIAHDDFRTARVLLEITLDRDDIDLGTFVAALTAWVRVLTTQGEFRDALTDLWEFEDETLNDPTLRRRAERSDAVAIAEWLHATARCALDSYNLSHVRMKRRELRNLILRRRLGRLSQALLMDLDARLCLARGETERALKHLDAIAALPGVVAPTHLVAVAVLQAGRPMVALGLLDQASARRVVRSLDDEIQFSLILARASLAAGDGKAAEAALADLPRRIEQAFGAGSLPAAEVDQLRAEIALARGRYSEADLLASRAERVFRQHLDPAHPTRIENELFRKTVPGHNPQPGATLALSYLAKVLGSAHPVVAQWRHRVDAALARLGRDERSTSE